MPRPATDIDALRTNLLEHARAVIARDGLERLTMRALAAEAGSAVGLSYKAFSSRDELVWELTLASMVELTQQLDDWVTRPGGALADRLMEFSDLHFASLAPVLVDHITRGPRREELFRTAADAGLTRSWAALMTEFLKTRQRAGDVRGDVDVEAFAFIITAAMHHVLVTEKPFTTPDRPTLARHIAGVAAQITVGQARRVLDDSGRSLALGGVEVGQDRA
ncbi:TetR/AcrR family transcriptional regulator [Kribbella catacumbae]|uniref:TetR/AcrR family transcriptional regulator n=1 Tax=Kribbella catacumbae TaxID=460086 RepID=UPI00035CE12A|nr:TetR/AcrR family transcriptional regulator [Kribbella catacumbae]